MPGSQSILGRAHLRFATSVACRRARTSSLKRVQDLRFERTLTICYGNIYRSPLVAACLRKGLGGVEGWEVRSAGFHEPGGRPSPSEFVSMARNRAGVELITHRSRVVTADDLTWADTILVMDRLNWYRLASMDIGCTSKVMWLGAFGSSASCDIPDPYGQPQQAVEKIVDRLMEATAVLVGHILAKWNVG
jgi:protein-tyrosine-phosphatase